MGQSKLYWNLVHLPLRHVAQTIVAFHNANNDSLHVQQVNFMCQPWVPWDIDALLLIMQAIIETKGLS